MKNLMIGLFIVALALGSCTPQPLEDGAQATDKDKICPPWDANCNGIPDDDEN